MKELMAEWHQELSLVTLKLSKIWLYSPYGISPKDKKHAKPKGLQNNWGNGILYSVKELSVRGVMLMAPRLHLKGGTFVC